MGRIAGIDYGTRRIGVAVSDPSKILASPSETVTAGASTTETAKAIHTALANRDLEALVLGMPYRMDGSVGPEGKVVQELAKLLEDLFGIPVILWDERLTTCQAEQPMREAGVRRKGRAKVVDALAAVVILQSYLDSL